MNNYLKISVDTDNGWIPVATIPFVAHSNELVAELLSETGLLTGSLLKTKNGGYKVKVMHVETSSPNQNK